MKPRRSCLILCAILLAGLAGFIAYASWQLSKTPMSDGHHPTPESFAAKRAEYERLIQNEIPAGSSPVQVERFLAAHQIEHGEIDRSESFKKSSDFEALQFPGKDEVLKSLIQARIRNAEHDGIVEWSLIMEFYFDEHDRLVTHTVDWFGTGP
ncbi:MAG TPA: hypothetical protein VGP73_08985 [Thermoanaerobaculia bacterium]